MADESTFDGQHKRRKPGEFQCPRCGGPIPNEKHKGQYRGAGSRITPDRSIEICSACGTDEAMGLGPVPVEEWWISGVDLKRTFEIPDVD